ncbi:hypothetical protein A4X06_0g3069 [Tilletia controversa]|uniref:DNA mismatch repair protein MSH3 n=1 Tax=Tilletia controversa TaxID=13291 RepID=A0A8X7MUR0_9BASI|nr:hypothetical protein A4X06_0g3069 [Tilletia controversa]
MSSIAAAPSAAAAGAYSSHMSTASSDERAPTSLQAQSTAAFSPFKTASAVGTSIRRPPSSRPPTSMSMRSNRPTTAASANTSQPASGVCAVIETRGIGREVGIAVLDQDTGRVTLCQLADTQTYIKTIQHLSLTGVAVLLAPGNAQNAGAGSSLLGERFSQATQTQSSVLLQCIEEAFGVGPTHIHRRHWNEKEGAAYIQRLIAAEQPAPESSNNSEDTSTSSIKDQSSSNKPTGLGSVSGRVTGTAALTAVSSKYYALSAACALFRYLESAEDASFRNNSLFIEYRSPEGVLFIGTETVQSLELLENNLNRKSKQCLFDAVEEMVHSEERYASVNQSLKPLAQHKIDGDKLISQVCMAERSQLRSPAQTETKIANVLSLRTFVRSLRPAKHALDGCSSGLLRAVRMFLDSDDLDEIAVAIESCINNDMLDGKVKLGKSGLAARNTRLLEIKTEYAPNQRDLPRAFINVVKGRSKTYTMSTLELKKRNQKMLDSMNEVLLLSDQTIEELRQEVTERVGSLFKASEAIAILDMLASFAHLVTVQSCVRPELTNTLAISNGRHPVLARFPTQKLVGNDVYASEGQSFTLINGPNMSGKSTYLQQIALLVIMASVGSFVPAEYASFPTFDAILTCECRSDNLAQQLSSFAAEMRATSFILSAATPRSLVLIDELGRATSTSEGFGFSHAVAERLIGGGTTTFWATHLTDLNVVLGRHFNVCSKTFQVDVAKRGQQVSMDFRHRIVEGPGANHHLGLQLARLAGVPRDVCDTAEKLAAELREAEERQRAKSKASAVVQRRKIILKLDALLRQTLESSRLPAKDLREFLIRLQDEATDELYETYSDAGTRSEKEGEGEEEDFKMDTEESS